MDRQCKLKVLVTVFSVLAAVNSFAADCSVILLNPDGTIVEPYVGGCNNGLASGTGQYSFHSQLNDGTHRVNGTFVAGKLHGTGHVSYANGTQFNGTFLDNKRDGEGKSKSPEGTWTVGTWKGGRQWNTTGVMQDKAGVRIAFQWSEGKQVGLCRSDVPQAQCSPDLSQFLSARSPPSIQPQTQSAPSSQVAAQPGSVTKPNELEFFRDFAKPNALTTQPSSADSNSPFSTKDIVDACESQVRNMEIGYHGGLEVYKIEVLAPVKPTQSGLPAMAIPQTDLLYPAKLYVLFTNGGGRRYTQVFIYKGPFGIKCMRGS